MGSRNTLTSSKTIRALLTAVITASTICALWYGSAELNNKNWDEGHSLRNVRSILTTGNWRPTYPFYPALSHLPQAAILSASQSLHKATGNEVFAAFRPNGNFSPTTYRVSRATSAVYGIGTLLLVFAVGRRMFDEATGLAAAAVLALSPYFLKASGIYKPDALLMLTAVVAFYFALRAAGDGRAGNYLLAGVAVGASAAAKQNGAFSSLPLILATALSFRELRRWLLLALAGAVSLGVFLAFNPWLELFPQYLRMSSRYLDWAADLGPAPHLVVFAAGLPFEWSWHGIALGGAAWIGLLGLAGAALKNRHRWPETPGPALLVLFIVLYPFACSLVSSFPKPNILIATLPFTSIAAAWALMTGSRWLLARGSRPLGLALFGFAAAGLFAVSGVPYATYLYTVAVPETTRSACEWIERDAGFLGHRTILSAGEVLGVGHRSWKRRPPMPLELAFEQLFDFEPQELDLADYEVFPLSALEGKTGEFYQARLAQIGRIGRIGRNDRARIETFEPRLFRRRGPGIVVLAHPWRLYRRDGERPAALPVGWSRRGKRRFVGRLPGRFARGQVLSLDLHLTAAQATQCTLRVDGVDTPVHRFQRGGERGRYMTRRFVTRRRLAPVRIECPTRKLFDPEPKANALRWVGGPPAATGG